jgi:hypothetical protein
MNSEIAISGARLSAASALFMTAALVLSGCDSKPAKAPSQNAAAQKAVPRPVADAILTDGEVTRIAGVPKDADPKIWKAPDWNGATMTYFVEYWSDPQVILTGVGKSAGGAYRKFDVTMAEEDAGDPEIRDIGRVQADGDEAQELAVLIPALSTKFASSTISTTSRAACCRS